MQRKAFIQDQLADTIKRFEGKADYLEIRAEESEGTTVGFRGKAIENVSQPSVKGGCVRALFRGGWGFVSFNDLSNLSRKIEMAISQAKIARGEKSKFAAVGPVEDTVKVSFKEDPREFSLSSKVKLFSGYNNLLLKSSPKIQSTAVGYDDRFKRKHLVNSEGTALYQEQAELIGFASAIAREGDIIQTAHQNFDGGGDFEALENLSDRIEGLARQAVELLKAPPAKAGTYTVVLGPAMSGLLAHEAFGHLSEADNVYENKDLRKVMKLGRRFGSKILNIIDDPTLPQYGHYVYDDEGVRAQRTYLIKEGVLVGRLHGRETAAKMEETPTGSARALSYSDPPIVRMSNTYVEPGQSRLEDLIKGVKLGILTYNWLGGSTTHEMFTFTAGWGRMIRNGRLAETVRDVKLTGNVFETLKNIDGVSTDLKWEAGYCGKRDQGRLPTATGGPYVRCRDVVVGGK